MNFSDFALHPMILKAVEACGLTVPTPVQEQAIPFALEGRDVLATAATGTGKTAAFLLPTLSRLLGEPQRRAPGAPVILILAPTRELAGQVTRATRAFGKFIRMWTVEIVGGMPYREQLRQMARPVEVVVATPGRLLDHVRAGRLDLSKVEALIIDEADRMFDMGFSEDVAAIAAACPADRQTLLFTATLDRQMETLTRALHGDLSQGQRNHTLKRLHDGRVRLLVATDVAARGIDVRDISHVFNFDLPRAAEDYVHRIGRTGRAGATGAAISFAGRDDAGLVIRIERFTQSTLPVATVPGLEPKLPPRRGPRPNGPRAHGPKRPFAGKKRDESNAAGPRPWRQDKPRAKTSTYRGDAPRKRA